MTYLRDDRSSGAADWDASEDPSGGDLPGRRRPGVPSHGAHSSDHAGSEQYTYQRPDDWAPRARRRYAEPIDAPTAETPVDWWGTSRETDGRDAAAARSFSWRDQEGSSAGYAAPRQDDRAAESYDGYGGVNYDRANYGGRNYEEPSFGGRNFESPKDETPRWDASSWDAPSGAWDSGRRAEGSAWDADALRAAAGVPYRELDAPDRDAPDRVAPHREFAGDADDTAQFAPARTGAIPPVPPPYGIPGQRRPFEHGPDLDGPQPATDSSAQAADAEVPIAPPADAKRSLPRKHLILRIAAVMVLVFSAAIGVAVTVLRDTDPDTVQVQEDVQADIPVKVATPGPDTSDEQDKPVGAELQQKQAQQQALDDAKSRASEKAEAAQKKAAEQAERAEDERASRSAKRSTSSDDSSSSGTTGDPVPTAPVDCNSYSGNKNTGCALLSEFGFASSQMTCLDKLWMKESGWRTSAENPSSGAYGIPQALPGSKMGSVASDWRTNAATQIRWGLGHIKGRYGTPCGAWSHSQSTGWY